MSETEDVDNPTVPCYGGPLNKKRVYRQGLYIRAMEYPRMNNVLKEPRDPRRYIYKLIRRSDGALFYRLDSITP